MNWCGNCIHCCIFGLTVICVFHRAQIKPVYGMKCPKWQKDVLRMEEDENLYADSSKE